ncbi:MULTISPECIES: mycoredoxin [unclassified Pseudactinotalea]|uniref:mycoredoxin n=1 Tax=Micrococcales TaxID=85006 RepID=UPI003C797C6D
MFSTTWCGYCRRLKSQMDREGIPYTEVNIENDEDAAAFVMTANEGNQTVPTLLFPDGSTATNPSLAEVKERIA